MSKVDCDFCQDGECCGEIERLRTQLAQVTGERDELHDSRYREGLEAGFESATNKFYKEREALQSKLDCARGALERIIEIDEYRKRVGGPRTDEADWAREALDKIGALPPGEIKRVPDTTPRLCFDHGNDYDPKGSPTCPFCKYSGTERKP